MFDLNQDVEPRTDAELADMGEKLRDTLRQMRERRFFVNVYKNGYTVLGADQETLDNIIRRTQPHSAPELLNEQYEFVMDENEVITHKRLV